MLRYLADSSPVGSYSSRQLGQSQETHSMLLQPLPVPWGTLPSSVRSAARSARISVAVIRRAIFAENVILWYGICFSSNLQKKRFLWVLWFLSFVFCFFVFLEARLAAEGSEVTLAVARDGARCCCELDPLGLVRVDVLAAALRVELAASLPNAVDAETGCERGLRVGKLTLYLPLHADNNSGLLGVAALAQHLLLQNALAVADDTLGLNDLGLGSSARHSRGCLASLRTLEQGAQPALVSVECGQFGVLLI